MAKTNAEKQAAFRAKKAAESKQLNIWISNESDERLKKLARMKGKTIAETIEMLLEENTKKIIKPLNNYIYSPFLFRSDYDFDKRSISMDAVDFIPAGSTIDDENDVRQRYQVRR